MPSNTDLYHLLIDNLQDAYLCQKIITDGQGNTLDYVFLEVNQTFQEMINLPGDKMIGKKLSELYPDPAHWLWDLINNCAKVAPSGDKICFEQYFEMSKEWYQITAFSGDPEHFSVVFHKNTDIKKLNEGLIDSESKFLNLLDKSPIGIMYVDIEGNILEVNPEALKVYGSPSKEATKTNINVFQYPPLFKVAQVLKECIANNELRVHEEYYTSKWGKSVYLRYRMNPQYGPEGEIRSCIISIEDITASKLAENALRHNEQLLNSILSFLPDATFVINQQGKVLFWNKAMENMTGIPKEEMIGQADKTYSIPFYGERCSTLIDWALLSDEEHAELKDNYDFVRQEGNSLIGEVYVPKIYGGQGAYLLLSASRLYDLNGNTIGAIESIRDISDREQSKAELYWEKELLRCTLLSIGDGVITTDEMGYIMTINQVAEQLTGWKHEEAIGKPLEEVFQIHHEFSGERCANPVTEVLETQGIISLANHTILISQDGVKRPIEDSAAPIMDEHGQIRGVVIVFRDFTSKREEQAQIEYLSFHDQLTGLYNRRYYEEKLMRLGTEKNLPLSMIMADVNGLKLINDAFGHLQGDRVLQKVAEIMKMSCGTDDITARIGGDEFIILLPQTDAESTAQLVQDLKATIAREKTAFIELSVSFGWAVKTEKSKNMEELFKEAEDHMYRHKLHESPSMRSDLIKTIIQTMYEKLPGEKEHSDRVSSICEKIGLALGYCEDNIAELKTAAVLHDIGKIILDEGILFKAGGLNDYELAQIQRHPETGYRILSSVNEMSQLAEYVLAHHENWDGTGYPKGLKGEEIPLQARIIRIADSYDAMISDRSYRKSLSKAQAIQEIRDNAGTQFDPYLSDIFINLE